MVDTTTTVLALVKQTVGANRNTWGSLLNTNFDMIEEAICGRHAISTTGGTTTLTQAQARKRFIDVTGALASDATIVVPNASKDWIVFNNTTGGFGVLVKTASGVATTVPPLTGKGITCDGVTGCYRDDIAEVGQMAFFGTSAVPAGWFEATGATKSRAGIGLDLFNKTGTTWGVGNGATTFGLPDSYTAGKFLRSRSASVVLGTSQSDQNLAHQHLGGTTATEGQAHAHLIDFSSGVESAPHGHAVIGSVDSGGVDHTNTYDRVASGSLQLAAGSNFPNFTTASATSGGASFYLHTHTININSGGENALHVHSVTGTSGTQTALHTHSFDTPSSGGTEARPTNLSAILCIKY
jgi:microcystin-dependent protein